MNKDLHIKKIKWLQVIRTPGIGPIKFWKMLKFFGCIEKVLTSLEIVYSHKNAEEEIKRHQKYSFHLVAAFEKEFPENLKKLADCPPFLSVYGDLTSLSKSALAIVGARNASLGGRKLSYEIASDLGNAGYYIISGLARGIDESAHRGALLSGTIAVLAGGIDAIYPPEHEKLYKEIAKNGAIISEMPLGLPPAAPLFPKRNRLIAALSQGVIVVEAAKNSGSLITAQCALDLGIEVFAVPGSPLDPRCSGSNALIKQGAVLIESAKDVLESLGYQELHQLEESTERGMPESFIERDRPTSVLKKQLLVDLSQTPISVEKLLETYKCSPSQLLSVLLELEISGHVIRDSRNQVTLNHVRK